MRRSHFTFIGIGLLGIAVLGCSSDGLTSQQRFELRRQQSHELHEAMMAQQEGVAQLTREMMSKQMDQSATPTTAPVAQ